MKRYVFGLAVAVLAAVPAFGQFIPRGVESASSRVTDDTDVAMYCKYIGTSACGKIAVAANGDVTFTEGTCGAEAATATFECPVSGGLGGVIDVSDAACNTLGEVVDIVNTSASGWRCHLYAGLRADSSNDTLLTISATNAQGYAGLGLAFDTDVFKSTTAVLAPYWDRGYHRLSPGPQSTSFLTNPWFVWRVKLLGADVVSTYGSGTSTISLIAVERTFGTAGSETATTLWTAPAGATTVVKAFGTCTTPATACDVAWGSEYVFPANVQALVRLTNADAMASVTMNVRALVGPAE